MTSLTRRYQFSASHRLHSDKLTPEQNRDVFGKCNNPFGHGHNYALEVTVEGEVDLRSGMVLPRGIMDAWVERAVLARLDHTNLNQDLGEFSRMVPTTENLGLEIRRWLERDPPDGAKLRLSRIRLEETGSNTIEIEVP